MVSRTFLLMGCILMMQATAQPFSEDTIRTDEEQKQLGLRYIYSNRFGYEIDSIQSSVLFETVNEWLGTRYCYGGNSKKGIDCSGLVSELYKKAYGIELEGSSGELFRKLKPLKKRELNEGDLVFFKIRKNKISHLGIYLGQNKFVHASIKQGVRIDDLDDPYYNKYYYKGGRSDAKLSLFRTSNPKN